MKKHAFITLIVLLATLGTGFAVVKNYKDIKGTEWYASAVQRLTEIGVLNGYPDGSFKPEKNVNRGEVAKAVDGLINYVEKNKDASNNPDLFDPLNSQDIVTMDKIILDVPFTSQAPFSNWKPPYDEACEEASLIMLDYHLQYKSLNKDKANKEILDLVNWEKENGFNIDSNASEVADIAGKYYGYEAKIYYDDQVTEDNIKKLISAGFPVIIPAQGQMLGNPNFSGDGPPYHMLVIKGYDDKYFYSNDPGTRNGESYKYKTSVLMNAIHDWTGDKTTIKNGRKVMIVLRKPLK